MCNRANAHTRTRAHLLARRASRVRGVLSALSCCCPLQLLHLCVRVWVNECVNACVCECVRVCVCECVNVCECMSVRNHTHAHTHTHTHTHLCKSTYIPLIRTTRACTRTHITHTHVYIHHTFYTHTHNTHTHVCIHHTHARTHRSYNRMCSLTIERVLLL